jgi:hypothetical protein
MGFIALSAPMLTAQSDNVSSQGDSSFAIRVEAREVVVPVYVDYKKFPDSKKLPTQNGKSLKLPMDLEISGLAAKDFHIYEDGVEQPVKDFSIEPLRFWSIQDSGEPLLIEQGKKEIEAYNEKMEPRTQTIEIGKKNPHPSNYIQYVSHMEYSGTPHGFWSSRDVYYKGGGTVDPSVDKYDQYVMIEANPEKDGDSGQLHLYFISYVPPLSVEGSCHQIKVTVDRSDASVFARNQYCNLHNSPSDPLKETKAGVYMETYNYSAQKTKLPLAVQAVATFNSTSEGRVNIAVEFPWDALTTYWSGNYRSADVSLLGLVYNENGTIATRFSDVAYSPKTFDFHEADRFNDTNRDDDLPEITESRLPTRYEAQINLPAGNYKMRIVLTDGKNLGSAELPLTVESYDPKSLAVSGIVFSRRSTNMAVEWPKYVQNKKDADQTKLTAGEGSTAPDYVPLVSNGIGITPTGDTCFHSGDRLLSYFEVYEPMLASGQSKVQFEARVTDAQTGSVKIDFGLRSTDTYAHAESSIIPIGLELPLDKLPNGAYSVEVQASDSTGKQTPWRSASFTVE